MSTHITKNIDFTARQLQVLRAYRLLDEKNQILQVYLERPEDKPLGEGPLVDDDALYKLIKADSTPGQLWLDWIFFQAGGGQRAKDASQRALEQTKERFIDERVNGFENPDTKETYKPVTKAEAEARWLAVEPRWRDMLITADQDVVDHLGVFGYHRSWPGKDKVYSRVAAAVTKFQKLRPQVDQMNDERLTQGAEPMKTEPENFASLDDLEKANRRVERYFASKAAREDIQIERIYEDERVRVVCPLTYAASVRYGFDNWAFSNRTTFDEVLDTDNSFRDAWKQTTQNSVLVFFYWKVPMPSWIARKENEFRRFELVNLALEIPRKSLIFDSGTPNLVFHDEENTANLNYDQLCKMIGDEVLRQPDPQDEEMPVKRGPNAYTTRADAQDRLLALRRAFVAIMDWAVKFDPNRVKSDTLGEKDADKDS